MAETPRTGLVQVYTGDGKGKTTAGVGLAVRARGAGMTVAFVQFVKGGRRSGELAVLESLGISVSRPAEASTGLLGAGLNDEDRRAAAEAWEIAAGAIGSGRYDVVVLDEGCVALAHGLIDAEALFASLDARKAHVEVVITGRGATPELIQAADLVTEMRLVKHPYERGIPARRGIEF